MDVTRTIQAISILGLREHAFMHHLRFEGGADVNGLKAKSGVQP